MNRPFSSEIEAELLRAAEAHPGQGLVLGADGVARPVEASHTPGPWRIETWHYENRGDRLVVVTDNDAVAEVLPLYRPEIQADAFQDGYAPEAMANARLLAAAPKLAEALRGAQKALRRALPHCPADGEHNGDSVFVGEWLDEVNEALALVPAA